MVFFFVFFFFQAEDGIRDADVTGVQTCALPISLMAMPADGLTLADKQATTGQLLRAGADIHALNTVRKHLSGIKGGRLAAKTVGSCRTFAISDVVGDDVSVIGSGPTVPD